MANIDLHQALTTVDQQKIKYKELDCAVNYVAKFSLEETRGFGLGSIFFRYGIPGKLPTGEFGYVIYGDVGLTQKPKPNPYDHRVSHRMGETQFHTVEYGDFHQYQSKITDYYAKRRLELLNPEVGIQFHLAALSRAIPTFLDGCIFTIFAGTTAKTYDTYTKKYGDKYIKPANGNTDGYKFYNSEGFESINMSEVITKTKATQHPLHTQLENINKALRNDSRKLEVSSASTTQLNTKWIKDNLIKDEKDALVLYLGIEQALDKINAAGKFETKYKHKSTAGEGHDMTLTASDCVVVMSDSVNRILSRSGRLKEQYGQGLNLGNISGAQVVYTGLLDKDEALIIPRELLQFWIMPTETPYQVQNFPVEETRDFIYRLAIGFHLIDIYPSIGVKLKA